MVESQVFGWELYTRDNGGTERKDWALGQAWSQKLYREKRTRNSVSLEKYNSSSVHSAVKQHGERKALWIVLWLELVLKCTQDWFYLFMFVCAWSSVLLGLFSSCSEQGLPSCCRAQALGCAGSAVGAWASRCSVACGIFLEGLNPCLLHWQVDSLSLSYQGSSLPRICFNQIW